jgi:hypothetical protein
MESGGSFPCSQEAVTGPVLRQMNPVHYPPTIACLFKIICIVPSNPLPSVTFRNTHHYHAEVLLALRPNSKLEGVADHIWQIHFIN